MFLRQRISKNVVFRAICKVNTRFAIIPIKTLLDGLVWWWKHKYRVSTISYCDFKEAQNSGFGTNVCLRWCTTKTNRAYLSAGTF